MRVDQETKKKVLSMIKAQAPAAYKKLRPDILTDDSVTAEYLGDLLISSLESIEEVKETE